MSQSEELPTEIDKKVVVQNLEQSFTDFKVTFTLRLLEACSLKFTVPMILLRTLLTHLSDSGDSVLARHSVQAKTVLPNIKTEMAHEYVRVFKISVPEDYFFDLASQEIDSGRFAEAAVCIANGDLYS